MKTVNLDEILKSYLTLEAVRANKPDYTYNMVLSAMKEACRQTLDLAVENAEVNIVNKNAKNPKVTIVEVDKKSIYETINFIV